MRYLARSKARTPQGQALADSTKPGQSFQPGNTKGGSITVPLISCLTGLESAV